MFQSSKGHSLDEDDEAASSASVLAASAWSQFRTSDDAADAESKTNDNGKSPPLPPVIPSLLRKPVRTFSVHQSKLLYQPETHISKWLDPYLCALWSDEFVQQARYCSAHSRDPNATFAASAESHALRTTFPTSIAFLQAFLIHHYTRLIDTSPMRLAMGDLAKWDDASKAPLLQQQDLSTAYSKMEARDAKDERTQIIARARAKLVDEAIARNEVFDAAAYDDDDYLTLESESETLISSVKKNPLSQLTALKSQPLITSNRDTERTRPYTCDLVCALMYAMAHMESVLLRSELDMHRLECELKAKNRPADEPPLHLSWHIRLSAMVHNATDFEYQANIERFYEALLRFKIECVYSVVWDEICALQDLYARLHAGARIYTWYFLQHELLSTAKVLPCPKVPIRWKRKLADYMRWICTHSRDFDFELTFTRLVYDHELCGNEVYRFVLEREEADLQMESREIMISSVPESEVRAMYTATQKDKLAILTDDTNPLKTHLMITIFEECFIQSMNKLSFLKYYFVSHRDFFDKHAQLKRMARTEEPYVERRPVIVCLLGKWVVWKGTGTVYQSNDASELILTWLYLVDQEYDGVLDIRGTSVNGIMKTLGVKSLGKPRALMLDDEARRPSLTDQD